MNDTALLELILGIGSIMGLKVVAEGVETLRQIQWLSESGCDELQGYFFSKPLPLDELLVFIAEYKSFAGELAEAA